MSDYVNPYNSPESPIVPEKAQNAGNLTETMLTYLREASPWMRFIGILGFIYCGFMVIGGLISMAGVAAASSILNEFFTFPVFLVIPFYLLMAVIVFFPSLFTYNFGTKIRKYQFSNSDDDLEQAFKNNKSLWKFYGILCIISLAIFPVIIILAIVIGVAAVSGIF